MTRKPQATNSVVYNFISFINITEMILGCRLWCNCQDKKHKVSKETRCG